MGIRKYKPTTPGRRGSSVADFVEVTRSTPEKSLVRPHSKGGRNNSGRVTVRHQGGGHKRAYRVIDFRRHDKDGVPAKVAHIEYDPNRTARIALLHYADGEKRYILAPRGLSQGDRVENGPGANIKPAATRPCATSRSVRRCTPSSCVPAAAPSSPAPPAPRCSCSRRRARWPTCACRPVRSAWSSSAAGATVGEVGNAEQSNINWGKAGRKRWLGVRPTVRGVVMNPVDHPHGGGEGRTSGGRHPVSPWGKKEGRTRSPKKASNKYIVRRRKTNKKR
ncbi:Large ribosomal subunit protein uL2 OS=Streptomyces albaduncus OX=68172 GN=rplB PE=3 SV=1 [Streptomyces griseoloalbus]